MKVKWGAFITEGRGKVGGTVLSRNRWGAFSRNLVTPVNVINDYTSGVRNNLNATVQAWKALSADQKAAWYTFAADHPRTDVFGDPYTLTGQTMMISTNQNLQAIGEAPFTLPGDGIAPTDDWTFTITSLAAGGCQITIENGGNTNADSKCAVFATAPISPGRTVVTTQLRQIGVIPADGSVTYDLYADYFAKFGDPISGKKVFIMLRQISISSGLAGVEFRNNAISS